MAIDDLWRRRDGSPSARDGRGLRWRVRVRGYPATLCRTKAEAEQLNAQRIMAGPPKEASALTVGECLDVWLEGKRALASYPSCRRAADACAGRWGRVPVSQVTLEDVQAWLDGMTAQDHKGGGEHPAAVSTRNKRLVALRGALGVAVRRGVIDADPTRQGLTMRPTVRREPHYLTASQLQALAEASRDPVTIWLMGTTGVRSGEAARLTVADVVSRRGGVRLRIREAKNGEPRDVPIPGFVLDMLDLDRPGSAPLLTAPNGGPLHMRNWRSRVFDPACERAGLVGITPHDLRHTAVSLAIAAGGDIKTVQRFAGHKTATMTLSVYGHLMDDRLDDIGRSMDGLFS